MVNDNFMGYEYTDILVERNMKSVYADGYENFGWTLEDSSAPIHKIGFINMKFKRNRKIINKMELTRLQHQFQSCAKEITALEKSKTTTASVIAYTIGIIGTAFMAAATFAYLAGMIPLCIILAIPGFIGWIVPYFCKQNISSKQISKVNPLIEKKYDEIYDVCEKAHSLII